MTEPTDTLVLGAGFAGLCTALWLQRYGYRVTLLDQGEPGEGASYGNAGIFANYAVLPNASRDTVMGLPRELVRRDSAISVRPHYWRRMLSFGRMFLRESGSAAFARNRQRFRDLLRAADGAFTETLSLASAEDLVVQQGCLAIYRDPRAWERVRTRDMPMRVSEGVDCRAVGPAEIPDLEPALAGAGAVGGVFYPGTRHLISPIGVAGRLIHAFRANGGRFERARIRTVEQGETDTPVAVTSNGRFAARRMVIALGAASRDLLAGMGYDVPLVSERGYHITLESGTVALRRPVGWLEHYFYATPMSDGVRLAGTTEFARPDAKPDARRWRRLGRWARTLFGPEARIASRWHGSRPTTPDGLPLVGRLPGHPAVFTATGHGHLGVTLSGITGKLLAEQIVRDAPLPEPAGLDPTRFLG